MEKAKVIYEQNERGMERVLNKRLEEVSKEGGKVIRVNMTSTQHGCIFYIGYEVE